MYDGLIRGGSAGPIKSKDVERERRTRLGEGDGEKSRRERLKRRGDISTAERRLTRLRRRREGERLLLT